MMYDQTCRSSYVETTLEMAGMTCSEDTVHKDLWSPEIRRGEKDLQTLITAFHNFVNPFEVEVKEDLFAFLLAQEPKLKL